jgi:hypothetical protein
MRKTFTSIGSFLRECKTLTVKTNISVLEKGEIEIKKKKTKYAKIQISKLSLYLSEKFVHKKNIRFT